MAIVTRKITIVGNKEITDVALTDTFTPVGKIERLFDGILDTDGEIDIPITNIGTISKIIVESTEAILRVDVASTDTDIPVAGILIWDVEATFAATIDKIGILTGSTTAVDIKITIIGV